MNRFIRILLICGLGYGMIGCASVSVKNSGQLGNIPPARIPDRIFVQPFSFNDTAVRVDRKGRAFQEFKANLQQRMANELIDRLSKNIAPAELIASDAVLPHGNYWLMSGRFSKINQGSRLMRSVTGLGTGATKMETRIVVCDLSRHGIEPFLLIETTGGSNVSPGVGGLATYFVSGIGAFPSVLNVFEGARTGVTFDAGRTAREITAAISEYLAFQGIIPKNRALRPKRLGEVPIGPTKKRLLPVVEATGEPGR